MRRITPKDIARAALGGSAVKQIVVQHMPPVRSGKCKKCPFNPHVDGLTATKCAVLKDELRLRPNAVWMCHETSNGGANPTDKSIICKGFADWRKAENNFLHGENR